MERHVAASTVLVILLLIPGPLACYFASCRRRTPLAAGPATAFIALVTSLAITSFVGLILLSLGYFRVRWLMASHGTLVLILLIGILRAGRQPVQLLWRLRERGLVAPRIAVLALLGLGLFLRLPPSFYTDGGQDEGVYVNMAAQYAKHGSLFIHDELLQRAYSGTEAERAALQPVLPLTPGPAGVAAGRYEGRFRLPGFYIGDAKSGTITPQFYHLHPLWLAMFGLVLGPPGSVYALTFFGLLALMAIYLLCRELFETPWVGAAAAAILAVNILQVWVNRFPVSETIAQFWLLAGLWLYLRWRRTGSSGEMWLSAACLGLYAFTRFQAVTLVPVYVVAFWLDREERRTYVYYNLVLALNTWALAHATAYSLPYVSYLMAVGAGQRYFAEWWQVVLVGGALLCAVDVVKWAFQKPVWDRAGDWLIRHRSAAMYALAVCGVFVVARHLMRLPHEQMLSVLTWKAPTVRLIQFSWYLTLPGLIAGLVGVFLLIRDRVVDRSRVLLAGVIAASLLFQFAIQRTNDYQFYYARYYMSEALPFCAIGLAFFFVWLARQRRRWLRPLGPLAAAGLLCAYVLPYTYNPAFRVREMDGHFSILQQVASRLPQESVTFVKLDGILGTASPNFATGLMYLMDRYALAADALSLVGPPAMLLKSEGKPVYLLHGSTGGAIEQNSPTVTLTPVAQGKGSFVISEHELRVPKQVIKCNMQWTLCELRARRASDEFVIRYDSTSATVTGISDGGGFGWTDGHARISGVTTGIKGPLELRIRLNHLFPPTVSPQVRVVVNGGVVFDQVVAGATLNKRAEIGPIAVPAALNRGSLTVEVISDTWVPAKLWPGNGDTRQLGLDVVAIGFRMAAQQTPAKATAGAGE